MAVFRRVQSSRAGAEALGILIPPGRRTLLIVRPRGLGWDLLPVGGREDGGPLAFQELSRDDAARQAQQLYRTLEGGGGTVRVAAAVEGGYLVLAEVGELTLLVCPRVPGQTYRPLLFAAREEASAAAERITAVFRPAAGTSREVYFNTQNFSP